MRVCFFIPSLSDGGAQRQCIALINALQHIPTVEVHLILLGAGVHDEALDQSRVHLHRTQVANFGNPRALLFVMRTIRNVQPDALISWLHPADIWSYVTTRHHRHIPWIMTERNSAYPDRLVFRVRKSLGRRGAAAVIANSRAGKELWESLRPAGPVRMIPNMVIEDRSAYVSSDLLRSAATECLFVGRLYPEKNTGAATRAFARFAMVNPEATMTVIGSGPESKTILEIAERAGISDRVSLTGFRRDVAAFMARSRVLISLSLFEGMPNVLMEAVNADLPAVVSDIPEHRALLGDHYPYYVSLDATPELAGEVIASAWANTNTGIYAFAKKVLATMTPAKVTDAYLDVFSEVIERVGPNRRRRKLQSLLLRR